MRLITTSILCIVLLASCQGRLGALKKVREKIQSTLSVCTQKTMPSQDGDAAPSRASFPVINQSIDNESVNEVPASSSPNSWDAKMAIW